VATSLSLEITARVDATCVAAVGEIDFASLGELERTLTDLDGPRPVELDLSGVSFIDSSGLAMLLSMRNLFAEGGGMLSLHAPSQKVRRVFELAGLSSAFTIVE
jgi:anti-sigma B factor antagonist